LNLESSFLTNPNPSPNPQGEEKSRKEAELERLRSKESLRQAEETLRSGSLISKSRILIISILIISILPPHAQTLSWKVDDIRRNTPYSPPPRVGDRVGDRASFMAELEASTSNARTLLQVTHLDSHLS